MLLTFSLALADDATLAACCRAGGGSSCPTTLAVRTEKSSLDAIGLGYELTGAWQLSCSGKGKWDGNYLADVDDDPRFGQVLTAVTPLAMHCFAQACSLPEGACIGDPDSSGNFSVIDCESSLPLDHGGLARPPEGDTGAKTVVVIDGKPLVAATVVGTPPPAANAPPAATYAPAPGYSAPEYAAPVATTTPVGTPAPAAAAPAIALDLPPDPPDPCASAPDAVRTESRKRVGTGDEYRITGRVDEALRDYKAALTMDKCNGYAWMSLSMLAGEQGRTDLAIRALRNTARLLPTHPGAFLMLGKAYESFGQRGLAADAYRKASELAPSNAEAIEGYMRTRGG
ncbi:MAG: tetratricopeptide repeat protein [Deltaproteobacteria bacterium]|nr:tetratricopeptide repeat protein [Deltaproteobacteria bacterium]